MPFKSFKITSKSISNILEWIDFCCSSNSSLAWDSYGPLTLFLDLLVTMWWQNTIGTLQTVWTCFKASTFSSSLFANVMSSKSSSKEILFSPNLQKSPVDFLCKFETLDLLTRTQAQPKGQTLFIQILSMDNRLLKKINQIHFCDTKCHQILP